ncbi:hypothetical protein CRG98_032065 [Punica granatum]|uniref:Uncharacterized protein n=1 Tax=Punica granatum TaxID=22663 RepID=A0A2I0ITZ5_PUNGR|nr:hypothetical protein CRG98_032065 [Punica granatum]
MARTTLANLAMVFSSLGLGEPKAQVSLAVGLPSLGLTTHMAGFAALANHSVLEPWGLDSLGLSRGLNSRSFPS